MDFKSISRSPLFIFTIFLFLFWLFGSRSIPYNLGIGFLVDLVLFVISLVIILKRNWKWYIKIITIFSYAALISALPIWLYSNTCTTYGYSYVDPLGLSKYPMTGCGMSLTNGAFFGHFLLADLAILGWFILFILAIVKKTKK